MTVRFSDLVMAPPDIYPDAMYDSERSSYFVPGYQPIGGQRTGFAYRPGVLAIDTSARGAHFFDLADYQRRRGRRGAIEMLSRITLVSVALFVAALVLSRSFDASGEDAPHWAIAVAALTPGLICTPFLLRVWLATRRDWELEHATPVEMPDWLIDWLAPMWNRVEKSLSSAPSEGGKGRFNKTLDEAGKERPFGDAFWKSFAEGMAEDIFGELGGAAAGAGADAALDRKGRAGERLANLIRRHAAWRIVRLHERAFGQAPVRVEADEWSAGMEFMDDRFPPSLRADPEPVVGPGD